MNRQLYVHLGEVISVCCYDSDTESTIQCDVQCVQRGMYAGCTQCWFHEGGDCNRIACAESERPDGKSVYFKTL